MKEHGSGEHKGGLTGGTGAVQPPVTLPFMKPHYPAHQSITVFTPYPAHGIYNKGRRG